MLPVYDQCVTETHSLYQGDNVEILTALPDRSIDFMVYSPPFSSLYTYSDSEHDMGNCRDDAEFFAHYRFVTHELCRLLKPGRLLAVHCMNLPSTKQHQGVIGLRDFRGALIRHHEADGMIYHSEVCIWKDPVVQMQRTKSIGLLYKQLRKDGTMSRQGLPDYLLVFRNPGTNPVPVTHTPDDLPLPVWQRYASPVWMDIDASRTLQKTSAREDKDERHIAPLQLDVIERAIHLWSNPSDIVLDPFMGIGSSGVVAQAMDRRFVGCELKASYYAQAVANIDHATRQTSLF